MTPVTSHSFKIVNDYQASATAIMKLDLRNESGFDLIKFEIYDYRQLFTSKEDNKPKPLLSIDINFKCAQLSENKLEIPADTEYFLINGFFDPKDLDDEKNAIAAIIYIPQKNRTLKLTIECENNDNPIMVFAAPAISLTQQQADEILSQMK